MSNEKHKENLIERICPKCKQLLTNKQQLDWHLRIAHSPAVEDQIKLFSKNINWRMELYHEY